MKPFRFVFVAVVATGLALAFGGNTRADDATTPRAIPTVPEKSPAPPLPAVFLKAQPENLDDLKGIEKQVKLVVEKVTPCTVCIRAGGSSGSGVLINADGYILTAGHVSGTPGRDITIIMPDAHNPSLAKPWAATGPSTAVWSRSPKPGKWPFVEMGSSSEMKKHDWCVVTGHPGGFKPGRSPVVRVGRILEINTLTDGQYIRTDCTIVGGDSGGPLFDMNGRVIGIHSRIGNGITANLHVPVDTYRDTWARLAKSERWGRGIGRPVPPTPLAGEPDFRFKLDPNQKEATVKEIYEDSPAFKAGLKAGDVIKKLQGKETTTLAVLQEELKKRRPGEEVTLDVQRGDGVVKIKFVVEIKRGV